MLRRYGPLFFVIAFTLLVAGYGGASAGMIRANVPHASSLERFLLQSGEQPGYSVSANPATFNTIASEISGYRFKGKQKATYEKVLAKAGFVVAVYESLSGSAGSQGFSSVVQFRTAAGAKTWTSDNLRLAKAGQGSVKIVPFTVPGIRSALGFTAQGSSMADANAYWSYGKCSFGAGLFLPDGATETAANIAAPVLQGIKLQLTRIGKTCP